MELPDDIIEYIASKLDIDNFINFIMTNKHLFNQLKSQLTITHSVNDHPEFCPNLYHIGVIYDQFTMTYKNEKILYAMRDGRDKFKLRLKNNLLDGVSYLNVYRNEVKVSTNYYIYNNGILHRNIYKGKFMQEVSYIVMRVKIYTHDDIDIINNSITYDNLIKFVKKHNLRYEERNTVTQDTIDYKLKYFNTKCNNVEIDKCLLQSLTIL